MIRHAYILLCHKWTEQLARLVARLETEHTHFFVHVNRRTTDDEYQRMVEGLNAFSRLEFIERQELFWGGIGMVNASLSGLRAAVASDVSFDFVSFITAQDYPIKSNEAIEDFLQEHRGQSFITVHPIPSEILWPDERHGLDRIEYWHFRKPGRDRMQPRDHIVFPRPNSFGRPPASWIWNALVACLPLKRTFVPGFEPYGGGCYWTFSGEAAEYIVQYIRNNPSYHRFFERVHIPDEIYYQTLLANSPLKDKLVCRTLRYIAWEKRPSGGPPAFLDSSDLPALKASGELFARKLDSSRDPGILDRIDRELRQGPVKSVVKE
ncbi:MAG: beta-1,6-N-acetylglucosaminyltransferase [Verrucomicrobiota bacterium]